MQRISLIAASAALAIAALGAPHAAAQCRECGTVTAVKTIKKEGEGSGVGAVLGGVAGGVLGHQVGSGRGQDVATVAGAAGGAYLGHQVEKKQKASTSYQVLVKMEDGNVRSFNYASAPGYKIGDKVKIANKKLVRR